MRTPIEESRATNASIGVVSFLFFVQSPEGLLGVFTLSFPDSPVIGHASGGPVLVKEGKVSLLISLGREACRCNRSVRDSPGEGFDP